AQAEFDTTITFHCTGGQTSNFSASATARNNCGVTQPVTSTGCSILCKTPPCVDNVSCQVPASACSNSPILLKGFAHNCGDRNDAVTLTVQGPGGSIIGSRTFTVAAGGQAEFDTTITLTCTPGAGTTYTVTAVASNDCGTSAPVASSGCTVQCLAGPCV